MKNSDNYRLAIFAISFLLGLSAVPGSAQTRDKDAKENLAAKALVEQCFTSGGGATFLKVCITNHGNLSFFESPVGKIHLSDPREGYAVCSGPDNSLVHGFDAGIAESGWGAPTATQPNGTGKLPFIVKRTSLDKKVQLTQTFTTIPAVRGVQVTMALKNISASPLAPVMARYFDADIDLSTFDIYDSNRDSVWGTERAPNGGFFVVHGLMLTILPSGIESVAATEAEGNWSPVFVGGLQTARGCLVRFNEVVPGPTVPGDFVGRTIMAIPTLQPGQTRAVTLRYRRF